MLYAELLRLWNESVTAMDERDWEGALAKLQQISEPTSRTLFNVASAHLTLGEPDLALKALDHTIAKDQRLAVGFFQRAGVMMQIDRLEEALSDCIWAQKHMRGNVVIDYRQLGLRFKLYSWQVLYNAAAVNCRMGQWERAREVLNLASLERGAGHGGHIEAALKSIERNEVLTPLLVPEGVVFRPRKQDIDELQQRDFLGKAKRGLLPVSLLELADVKRSKGKKENKDSSGIPLPPGLKPPTRPQVQLSPAEPPHAHFTTATPPPSYTTAIHAPPTSEPPEYTANTPHNQEAEAGSVVVKVHYTYTVALSVPLDISDYELKEQITQKLSHPASQLRLRYRRHGSRVLTPLSGDVGPSCTMQDVAEAGRAILWCQKEDPLANRTILYQMLALYDYSAQGPEDLEFNEGDTIDILGEVNEEWLEGHCAGNIGIFPSCFAYKENDIIQGSEF
ncbi:NADPH oxidase activator 1 isoform X3 [Cololabis saira]|uniref:NADPH oxidase activator 1 isoform X3 n=1 Tax=Cololabis saira TaxID=129043 RepID=UPI002AD2ACF4|nr:NADPH oxidase activator 1 isoform X3 [Cololabis saira]